jgi:hypothetical protein
MADRSTQIATRYGSDTNQPYYTRATPMLLAETEASPEARRPSEKDAREWSVMYNHFESRYAQLYNWRLPYWVTWGQIARFQRPDRYYLFIQSNQYDSGYRRDFEIVDCTATLAGNLCGAGIFAGITDPDTDWYQFGPDIPGFELDQAGQQWYEDVGERYGFVLDHSNFYEIEAQSDNDLVFFGTSPTIDYEDADKIFRCASPCPGEYLLGNGFDRSDEVLYEETRYTVSQLVEGFGVENLPEDVLGMWRQKGGALETEFVVGHAIEPNFAIRSDYGAGDVGVVPGDFTWREAWWLRGKKDCKPLSLAGFKEQPFVVKRWNLQGNAAYGTGVGEDMLGDTIQLQFMTRQLAMAIQKVNDPPMGADVALMNQPAATTPGNITYFNTANGGDKRLFPLYQIDPKIQWYLEGIKAIQERIGRTGYVDVMQPLLHLREETKGQVTATEIDGLKEERLIPLGPVFGRSHSALRQRVKRQIAIMGRRGMIPPKPPSLRGVPTKIDLISALTRAQKATRTGATARTAQFVGSLIGAFPEAKAMLDVEATVRNFNDGVGGPAGILRSPQAYKKEITAQAKQAASAASAAQVAAGANAAKSLSQASLAPGNALSALVQPGGGAQ